MLRRYIFLLLGCMFIGDAFADANTDAFNEGKSFGTTQTSTVKSTITTTNGSANVPGYSSTSGESVLFNKGNGVLTPSANADVANCNNTTSASDPNTAAHGHCESVRMMTANPNKKASLFPIDPTKDPIIVQGNAVKNNPNNYTGSGFGSGSYSACVNKTTNTGAVYEDAFCTESLALEDKQCVETLNVTVTKKESCVPGTYIASGLYAARGDSNRIEARCDFDPKFTTFRIMSCDTNQGCYGGGWRTFTIDMSSAKIGNSPVNAFERVGGWTMRPTTYTSQGCNTTTNMCSITFGIYEETSTCPSGQNFFGGGCNQYCTNGGTPSCTFGSNNCRCPNGGSLSTSPVITRVLLGTIPLSYPRPRFLVSFTDTWDDQCASYKARLP